MATNAKALRRGNAEGAEAGNNVPSANTAIVARLNDRRQKLGRFNLDRFVRDMLLDALQQAMSSYWQQRADTFAWVGTPECDRIAEACRNRATVIERYGIGDDLTDELDRVLGEVA